MLQYPKTLDCPHCKSTKFIHNGKFKNIQCYKCKSCNKKFRDTTNTPLYYLHKKDKVEKYLEALRLGLSIRKAATYVDISKNTAFAWRHKFLSSFSMKEKPKESKSAISTSIIELPFSNKGKNKPIVKPSQTIKSVLMVSESNIWISTINEERRIYEIAKTINNTVINGYITTKPKSCLGRAVKKQENLKQIENNTLKSKYLHKIVKEEFDLLFWLSKFRGVASKYLQHYWDWYISLKNSDFFIKSQFIFNSWAISSLSIFEYRNKRAL